MCGFRGLSSSDAPPAVSSPNRDTEGMPCGAPEIALVLDRVFTNDPGTGVMRHVDAGYDEAIECAKERGVDIPMM